MLFGIKCKKKCLRSKIMPKKVLALSVRDYSSPSQTLEPVIRATRIATIDVWVEAFYVFVGFPHEPPGLMKYDFTIPYLSTRGHKWCFYDENVTFLPQTPTISIPWSTIYL